MGTRLDRLILAEIAAPFVFGVLLFTSLIFAGGEARRLLEFAGQGVSPLLIGKLLAFALPQIVALTFPMAILLAALMAFGRLSSDSELVAILASGTSFARVLVPVGVFAFGVSLLGFWFGDAVVPRAVARQKVLLEQLKNEAANSGLAKGFTLPPIRDKQNPDSFTLVHIEGGFDTQTQSLRRVSIQTWQRGVLAATVFADQAKWKTGTRDWELSDAWIATRGQKTDSVTRLGSGQTQENLGTPDELRTQTRPVEEVSITTLQQRIARAQGSTQTRDAQIEIARRIQLPFASLIFALVGAPLGVQPPRAGKGMGFALAILIIFVYWTSFQMAVVLARSGALPPLLALALPNLAGIGAAMWLARRTLR